MSEPADQGFGGLTTGLARDLRFGLRLLRKHPGSTAAAVLALADAVGLGLVHFGGHYWSSGAVADWTGGVVR